MLYPVELRGRLPGLSGEVDSTPPDGSNHPNEPEFALLDHRQLVAVVKTPAGMTINNQ
jgi:hypothetical protein